MFYCGIITNKFYRILHCYKEDYMRKFFNKYILYFLLMAILIFIANIILFILYINAPKVFTSSTNRIMTQDCYYIIVVIVAVVAQKPFLQMRMVIGLSLIHIFYRLEHRMAYQFMGSPAQSRQVIFYDQEIA